MMDHVAFLREFFAPSSRPPADLVSLGNCESLFPHLKTELAIAAKNLALRSVSIQQALGNGELDNVYWLWAPESPADRFTKVMRFP